MDSVFLDVYLFFKGDCREAMEFYKGIFGGELTIQTYSDAGMEDFELGKEKIMHARLEGGLVKLMASDTAKASPKAAKISLSLGGTDETKLREAFEKLSQNGEVQSELKKEFWGDIYGSLSDKFGIEWMVNIAAKKE